MVRAFVHRSLQMLMVALVLVAPVFLVPSQVRESAAFFAATDRSVPSVSEQSGDLPNVTIETSSGYRTTFSATGGATRLATMFYSHCPGVCPMTIDALRRLDGELTPAQRAKLGFVLLSLDPANDTPEKMRVMASERGINSSRWLIGRASVAETAAFADAMHMSYRNLSDGSIDHSSTVALLDERGRVVARANDMQDSPAFIDAVRRALDSSSSH